ncbi:hypothetical protein RFI_40395, partial [Reticulomyxa filosa]
KKTLRQNSLLKQKSISFDNCINKAPKFKKVVILVRTFKIWLKIIRIFVLKDNLYFNTIYFIHLTLTIKFFRGLKLLFKKIKRNTIHNKKIFNQNLSQVSNICNQLALFQSLYPFLLATQPPFQLLDRQVLYSLEICVIYVCIDCTIFRSHYKKTL